MEISKPNMTGNRGRKSMDLNNKLRKNERSNKQVLEPFKGESLTTNRNKLKLK